MELCLNPDKKSTKELLISILSSNWPLSAKELFFQLKKTGISVTYQAVHKSLTELQKKGIVEKEHNKYLINIEWINELIDYCGQLENNYLAGIPKRKEDIPDKVIFNKLFMIYIFFMEVLTKNTFNKEDPKRIVCFKDFYMWNPLVLNEKHTKRLKQMVTNNKLLVISQNASPFDKLCSKFWGDYGIKIANGIQGIVSDSGVIVVGNYIFNIYYPKDILNFWGDIYKSVKNAGDIDIMEMHKNFFYKPTQIKMTVTHDKDIAAQIRQEFIEFFSKKENIHYPKEDKK